jgi:hypothetical protein
MYNADETFILLCHARQFPKLQTHNSVWFKESTGSCNSVVQFKHVQTDKWKVLVIGKRARPQCFKGISMTVDQFCTMLTKMQGGYLHFLRNAYELGYGITMEIKDKFTGSCQLCSTPTFIFFETYPTEISDSQHHIPGTANGHGNHTEFEDLISHKAGKLYP